jgi:hypothetical protein
MLASAIFFRYSSTMFSSESSPSSFLMASICCRRMYSRWFFCMPSATSDRILSVRVSSAKVSLAQATTFSRRASTSSVSRISTFCSKVRSGE